MKAVIVGCGRVGSTLADELDRAGWQVLIIDVKSSAFNRLPTTFGGTAIRGDGTDEDVLRRAGAEAADLFLALTEGDNRNVMSAQLAIEALGAARTIAKINDPVRAEAYAHLGVATLCRTNLMTLSVMGYLDLPTAPRPGIYAPQRTHEHATGDPTPLSGAPASAGTIRVPATGNEADPTSTRDRLGTDPADARPEA